MLFPENDRFLRRADVETMVGLKKSTLYSLIREQMFPAPVRVGGVAVWRKSAIETWMDAQERSQKRSA